MNRPESKQRRTGDRRAKLRRTAWIGGAGLLALVMAALAAWPAINDVTTGSTAEYPDIQPRDYRFSAPRVVAAAVESIDIVPRFTLVSADEDTGVVEATARSRSGLFTDDVTVTIEANGEAGSIVFIRSRSRVGRGDFGQNARNIRVLQRAMDANLGVE